MDKLSKWEIGVIVVSLETLKEKWKVKKDVSPDVMQRLIDLIEKVAKS